MHAHPALGAIAKHVVRGTIAVVAILALRHPAAAHAQFRQFSDSQQWVPTTAGFTGSHGTAFADVTGDGRADAIAISDESVTVRRSNGGQFLANETWTANGYYGSRGTYFADVDGDGRADAIAVNDSGITVRRSDGCRFLLNEPWTPEGGYYGSRGTFADVTGDRRADAIAVDDNGVTVRPSGTVASEGYWEDLTTEQFTFNEPWTPDGGFYGSRGTDFADISGDGRADAIAVDSGGVRVRIAP